MQLPHRISLRRRSAATSRAKTPLTIAILSVIGLIASIFVADAFAAPGDTPTNELMVTVRYDGTAFVADPLNDGTGTHTPGADQNATNNVVRTFDRLSYAIDWNNNEAASTNLVIVATLPPGTQWLPDPNEPPANGCRSDGPTPSSISANGLTLTCYVGNPEEGQNGQIRPMAIVEPIPGVPQLYDGDNIRLNVSMTTSENPTGLTAFDDTTVSAIPTWNWAKGVPEVIENVSNGTVDGKVFVYPITLSPYGTSKIGSEPIKDSVPITFWDHALDLTASAVPAVGLMPSGRSWCGGYDGTAAYPYGKDGLGDETNTTAGADTASEVVTCTNETTASGNGYPTVKINITGYKTDTTPPKTANGKGNRAAISTQVAFWMPTSEMVAKGENSDGVPNNGTGSAFYGNTISGTIATIAKPSGQTPAASAPIAVPAYSDSATRTNVESVVPDNTIWSGFSFGPGGSVSGGGGGGTYLEHRTRFLYPLALAEMSTANSVTGTKALNVDTRVPHMGGIGQPGFSEGIYFQNGTAPRSQEAIMELSLQGSVSSRGQRTLEPKWLWNSARQPLEATSCQPARSPRKNATRFLR